MFLMGITKASYSQQSDDYAHAKLNGSTGHFHELY
jgi:hypothetical protein